MCIYDVAKTYLRLCKITLQRGTCFLVGSKASSKLARWHVVKNNHSKFIIVFLNGSAKCHFWKRIWIFMDHPHCDSHSMKDFLKQKSWESKGTEILMKKVTQKPLYSVSFRVMLPKVWALTETQGLNIWMIDMKKRASQQWQMNTCDSRIIHNPQPWFFAGYLTTCVLSRLQLSPLGGGISGCLGRPPSSTCCDPSCPWVHHWRMPSSSRNCCKKQVRRPKML